MIPTFGEMRNKARREKRVIICQVIMANDDIKTIKFGPRGGWKIIKNNACNSGIMRIKTFYRQRKQRIKS